MPVRSIDTFPQGIWTLSCCHPCRAECIFGDQILSRRILGRYASLLSGHRLRRGHEFWETQMLPTPNFGEMPCVTLDMIVKESGPTCKIGNRSARMLDKAWLGPC